MLERGMRFIAKLAIVAGIAAPLVLRNEWATAGGWLIIAALAYLLARDREALDRREARLEALARKLGATQDLAEQPKVVAPRLAAPAPEFSPGTLH